MNSEGRIGVVVEWLTPASQRNYGSLVEGVDFIIKNPNKVCPRIDGGVVSFEGVANGENHEWLLRKEGRSVEPDYAIYTEKMLSKPTNIKDSELTNYNLFVIDYVPERRSNAEIIETIRSLENEANNSVLGEAERNKLQMLAPAINMKLSSGLPLNTQELAVKNRMLEVAEKAMLNASNAESLINQVLAGNTPNVNTGWEYDNITSQGFPFA